jgi:hypothetical protein
MSSKWNNFINSFADRSSFSKLNELSTGVLYGGTITSDYTINKVDIEAGVGQLLIKEDNCEYLRQFSWGTIINYEITDVGSYEYTVIYVDRFGTIRQRKTMLTDEELETNIVLAIVFHIDNIKVNQIINQKTVPLDTPGRVITFLRKLGLMRINGLSVEPNIASLKLNRSEGTIFGLGVNYFSGSTNVDELYLSGETFCNILYVYKNGTGGFVYDNNGGLFYSDLDPNFYDDGTGTLQALGVDEWTVQRCYMFHENPLELVIYYGQYKYVSYDEARASLEFEVFDEDEISKRNAVFLGYMFVKNGATDLSNLNDCKILQSGFIRNLPIGGGGSGSTGSTISQDLDSVLTIGNNAGFNDIDLNNNDLLNVNNINLNTINGAAYPPTGSTIVDASGVTYDNISSGLSSTDVQGAIDELNVLISGITVTSDKGSFGASADASTLGLLGYITIPYNGTITGWQVIGDAVGSCVFDVWKTASGIIPTVANTIAGSEKPTLTAQQINSDLNLTTWATTSIAVGDIIGISLDSASSLTSIWLTVFTTKLP